MDLYVWTATGMSRQPKAGGVLRYAREMDINKIAQLIEENSPRVTYAHQDDTCGAFGCCDEVTYKGHAKDCWWVELKRLVQT